MTMPNTNHSNLEKRPNLGLSASKWISATISEDARKKAKITELRTEFERRGFAPFMAEKLAEEKYRLIHKNG